MNTDLAKGQTDRLVVKEETIQGCVRATADTALRLERKKGNGNRETCNLTAVGAMTDAIDEHVKNINVVARISERKKGLPCIPENTLLTRSRGQQQTADAILVPLECVSQLARTSRSTRASTVLVGLAPEGSFLKVNSSLRTRYLVLPPGSPVGPGQIQLYSHPRDIVKLQCRTFSCEPKDIVVTILVRPWTADLLRQFEEAGATVLNITAGDFQAMVEAAAPVTPGKSIHIAAGMGGTSEAFVAAFYCKCSGGTILMQQVPGELELQPEGVRTEVADKDRMIRGDDCLLAVAGVTEAGVTSGPRYVVPGVRRSNLTRTSWVSVLVVSPEECRSYVVEYEAGKQGWPILLRTGESLDDYFLMRYLAPKVEIETRLRETSAGDREYFQQWWQGSGFVPGLEGLSERQMMALLHSLKERGRVVRREKEDVSPWDTSEYRVYWTRAN